jgi:tryptophanyl-tRNA synthetase
VNNLLEIYELLTGQGRAEIEASFAGKGYGDLKRQVAEVVIEALASDPGTLSGLDGGPA